MWWDSGTGLTVDLHASFTVNASLCVFNLWHRHSELKLVEASAEGVLACYLLPSCSRLYGITTIWHLLGSSLSFLELKVTGYLWPPDFSQFGKAIICSDAAAEAARYGFTAVDRPEGFLVLAVASLGDEIIELQSPPEVRYWVCGQHLSPLESKFLFN